MNLGDMVTNARLKLRALSAVTVLEPLLVNAANEGHRQLAKIIRQAREDFFVTTASVTIPAATYPNCSIANLPSDFAELKEIIITTSGMQDIDFVQMDQSDNRFRQARLSEQFVETENDSFYYDIYGNNNLILAPPAKSQLVGTLWYIQQVADLTTPDSTPTLIPAEHHDYIVSYMVCEGLRSTEDGRLLGYLEKLGEQKTMIIESVNARQIREPIYVVGYMEDEQGLW